MNFLVSVDLKRSECLRHLSSTLNEQSASYSFAMRQLPEQCHF